MNPVNKAQVKEFAETFNLTDKQLSEQFELYSVYSILNGGSGEHVDPFDAHLSGTEFGLDGVAIIIQGNLVTDRDEAAAVLDGVNNPQIDFYFFQSKISTDFDYGSVTKFFNGIKEFLNDAMAGESPQLDDLIDVKNYIYQHGVKRQNPGLHCFYVTTGNYDQNARLERLIENTLDEFREMNIFDEERIRIDMLGAGALQRLYRAAVTASAVTVEFDKSITLPENESVEEGYIGYLPASQLLKIVSVVDQDGEILALNKSVFFDNIRDYNPGSRINKEVAESLAAGRGIDFIFRNNGVTVVAKSIKRTGNNFRIEDFQVVNGCQTSNIVYNNRERISDVNVPFRLIGTRNEDFIFSIISGTNKQNPVRDEQFWSLLPFMKNLEEFARSEPEGRRIYLERRENQYKS